MGNLASNEKKKKVVVMVLEWSNSARKSIKIIYQKLTLVTLVTKVLTKLTLVVIIIKREDSIGMPFVHILGGLGGHMSSSTFVSFFRQKIYPSAYKITTFLFSKRRQNLKTVKCVSNFKKWFVMMINACDHLDSCIWG